MVTEPSSNSDDEWDALLDAHGLTGTATAVAQPAAAAGASRRARDASPTTAQGFQALHVEGHLVRSHCRFVHLLAVVFTPVGLLWLCARFRGSCHLTGPRVLSCGFGRLWHCATALAWFLVHLRSLWSSPRVARLLWRALPGLAWWPSHLDEALTRLLGLPLRTLPSCSSVRRLLVVS